jgi:hypothetical protein
MYFLKNLGNLAFEYCIVPIILNEEKVNNTNTNVTNNGENNKKNENVNKNKNNIPRQILEYIPLVEQFNSPSMYS